MPIDLYHYPGSAPCLSVRLVAAAVGIDLNLKLVRLLDKEQFQPEFVKINPQHTVPTIDDIGFVLWESRAICTYLIEKYGKNDSKDSKQRGIINQRLYFDLGTLYNSFREYFYPQLMTSAPADSLQLEKCHEGLDYLDKFLEGQNYVAGHQMTVTDLVIVTNVLCFTLMNSNMSRHDNTLKWLERIKSEAPMYEEIMNEGVEILKAFVDQVIKK